MSCIVWAVRPDGGQVAVDLGSGKRFELRIDKWGYDWVHYIPDDLWIFFKQRWAGKVRNGQICGKVLIDHIAEVLTAEVAASKFREAGLALPPELAGLSVPSEMREPEDEEQEPLTTIAELLLAGLEALPAGWHTAKEIASSAKVTTAISRVRETLGWMKRLKYVDSGMKGYKRTGKAYPRPLPQV